jgi:hypothetical protein
MSLIYSKLSPFFFITQVQTFNLLWLVFISRRRSAILVLRLSRGVVRQIDEIMKTACKLPLVAVYLRLLPIFVIIQNEILIIRERRKSTVAD